MPVWLVWFLLIVFVAHLVVFARLAFRHRNLRYSLVTLTFVLLVASFSLRLGAPEWMIGQTPVHWLLRYAAWVIAAITISWLIRLKVAAKLARREHGPAQRMDRRPQ